MPSFKEDLERSKAEYNHYMWLREAIHNSNKNPRIKENP